MQRLPALLTKAAIAGTIAGALPAQLTINEVLVDPVGPNTGAQIIEVVNDSGAMFQPAGWFLCSFPIYASLPIIAIPDGGVVRLHIGASGSDSPSDWYFPGFPTLGPIDSCQLYRSMFFEVDTEIVDHVSWGGAAPRADQATNIGQWSGAGDFVPLPGEGRTIAFDGTGDSAEDWFRDATPTLGAPNGTGVVSTVGTACATSAGTPTLTIPSPAVDGNLDFVFSIAGATPGAPAAVFVGTPSGGLPVFGCSLEVLPFADVPTTLGTGGAAVIPLGLVGSVQGLGLAFQALVLDPASPNGLFGASHGVAITFGG